MVLERLKLLIELVRFEHTLFALPFAYVGIMLGAGGISTGKVWFWVTAAMAGARTAAMALNRLIDRDFDAENPRTRNRPLPQGRISSARVLILSIGSLILLIIASWQLNPLCLALSPVAVLLLAAYSYTKRFTWGSHFVLGFVLASAPVGGWLAVTGAFSWQPLLAATAVLLWVSGFDIIYATMDVEFDRARGLFSIPQTFGVSLSLALSGWLHAGAFLAFGALGLAYPLGLYYFIGVCLIGALLIYEHSIVSEKDLTRVNEAFFFANAAVSLILFSCTLADFLA
ncbi:MAG: UbiA family prenyltransferase [Armatimonadetes bacterium]|nr:UbiA family prenyltransferase [Armatimonadota bacterium]